MVRDQTAAVALVVLDYRYRRTPTWAKSIRICQWLLPGFDRQFGNSGNQKSLRKYLYSLILQVFPVLLYKFHLQVVGGLPHRQLAITFVDPPLAIILI